MDLSASYVNAVLFDFSGTLFDDTSVLNPTALVAAAESHGVTLGGSAATEVIKAVIRHATSPQGLYSREGCDLSQDAHRRAWLRLFAEAGPFGPDLVKAIYQCLTDPNAWRPYQDTVPVLEALHARGVQIGVLSNIGWNIRPALARAGVLQYFRTIVLSCEHGLVKPDGAVFKLACRLLNVPPRRALYVGDDPINDGAAVHVGLPVYLLPSPRNSQTTRGLAAILPLVATQSS